MKTLFCISLLIFSSLGFAGNEGAHGGDSYAFEFVSIAKEVQLELAKESYADIKEDVTCWAERPLTKHNFLQVLHVAGKDMIEV